MSFVSLVAVMVDNYDEAILFYCDVLGFELVEDSPRYAASCRRHYPWRTTLGAVRQGRCV